ncbi:MAG: hypothetical protein AAB370_01915 [Verrucomicrobiota bacterium]
MKTSFLSGAAIICGALLLTPTAFAAPQAKSYQVTGPVVEVTETAITVKKGEDNWQIARDAGTKINGDLKVGAKVTIQYRMIATDVEVKGDKAEATEKPVKAKKTEKQ